MEVVLVQRLIVEEVEIDGNAMSQTQRNRRSTIKHETQARYRGKLGPQGLLRPRQGIEVRIKACGHASLRSGMGGTCSGAASPSR